MPAGRPLKFKSPEELEARIKGYFNSCKDENGTWKRPLTITGLALALDTSRETLCEYAEKDQFVDTIRRAKLTVEQFAEEQLYLGKQATGPIFALKNFGWSDKSEQHNTGSMTINWPLGKTGLDE